MLILCKKFSGNTYQHKILLLQKNYIHLPPTPLSKKTSDCRRTKNQHKVFQPSKTKSILAKGYYHLSERICVMDGFKPTSQW